MGRKRKQTKEVILTAIKPGDYQSIYDLVKRTVVHTTFPKGYIGWVYLYVIDEEPLLWHYTITFREELPDGRYTYGKNYDVANGKIAARFWYDEHEVIINDKGKETYAWKIKQLDIFHYPDELKHFKVTINDMIVPLTKAPRTWMYVWPKRR